MHRLIPQLRRNNRKSSLTVVPSPPYPCMCALLKRKEIKYKSENSVVDIFSEDGGGSAYVCIPLVPKIYNKVLGNTYREGNILLWCSGEGPY